MTSPRRSASAAVALRTVPILASLACGPLPSDHGEDEGMTDLGESTFDPDGGASETLTQQPDVGVPPMVPDVSPEILARLQALSPSPRPAPPPDPTNRFADDPRAIALGHQLFFDPRFSGPLLSEDHDGTPGTLGLQGEPGRVSCENCHLATADFLDARSSRRQISLGSGWTRRRAPSLLEFGWTSVLMWDGRRDTAYNQVFGVIDNPLEFNSSRLFVAQQIERYYRAPYEAIFGPMPSLAAYAALDPGEAGCSEMPDDELTGRCPKPGHDDDPVLEIVVNMGKAIAAYERQLTCGPSRFDAWVHGDPDALTAEEQAGAVLFVELGCDDCHSGPAFSDQRFYNVGVANRLPNFVEPYEDPGAAAGLREAVVDPLNARGRFSDGDDGRLDGLDPDDPAMLGAFRTPSLRCVGRRPSFMHAGQVRSLDDAVRFFVRGGDASGFLGEKDPRIVPLSVDSGQREQLVAFLRALDGAGPDAVLTAAPELPL